MLASDTNARIIGWGAHADACAANIADSEVQGILTAYAQGVNYFTTRYKSSHQGNLPPTFLQFNITNIDPWTPGDSLLCWWFLQRAFEGNWTTETNDFGFPSSCPPNDTIVIDPTGAVDLHAYQSPLCLDDLKRPVRGATIGAMETKKASHDLVLNGLRSTTNSAVMLGKPQLWVSNPGVLYEYAVKGGSYDCRGAGIPGCPGLLVGWSRNICWSVTAMPVDNSDLYQLTTPTSTSYILDNVITSMTNVHNETILVKGGSPVSVPYADTVWGPVVTSIASPSLYNATKGFALCYQTLRDTAHHTIEATLGLMKATDWCSARTAMGKWRGPGVHLLYGDAVGNIGYTALGALPIRPANDPCPISPGCQPQDGTQSISAWTGEVPLAAHPWIENPFEGFLSTANNLAIDPHSLPDPYKFQYGAPGDTERSWRLRELMTSLLNDPNNPSGLLTPAQTLAIDHDCVNAPLRVMAELAPKLQAAGTITGDALLAAKLLSKWNDNLPQSQWWQMLPSNPNYEILSMISAEITKFRVQGQSWQSLVQTFGAGGSGAMNFLKHVEGDLLTYAAMQHVQEWAQEKLSTAYYNYTHTLPPPNYTQFTVTYESNAWLNGVDGSNSGSNSPVPGHDYSVNVLCPSGGTIWSQKGEAYKFHVTMQNVDNAMAMLPPGVCEDFTSAGAALFRNHESDWLAGNMYPAPITQSIVLVGAMSTTTLLY
jgi:acyl-homoserine lactone acylase PvdQ